MSDYCVDFPATATAGLNFSAAVDLPDYPAGVWTLTAILRGPGTINLNATANGTQHVFNVAAASTASWVPGAYRYSLRATNSGNVFEVAAGSIEVRADLANVTVPYDGRSDNEKALDAIEAVIAGRASIDQQRYRINNRELWRTTIADLLKLQAFYKVRVRRERNRAKGCNTLGRAVQVRFS